MAVAREGLVEAAGGHAVEASQVCIEDDAMTSNSENQRLKPLVAESFRHIASLPGITI